MWIILFAVIFFGWAVMTGILLYHWVQFAMNHTVTVATFLLYGVGSFLLLLIIFFATLALGTAI